MRTSLLALLLVLCPGMCQAQVSNPIDAERSVQTLLDELSNGYVIGSAEKPVNRLGDAASVALTKIFADKVPTSKDIENMIFVIRQAFARPSIVVNEPDRRPNTTVPLLHSLEALSSDARLKERIVDTRRLIVEVTNFAALRPPENPVVEDKPEYEILLPLNIDSSQVQIRYYLTGPFGGYGSFTKSESGKHEYQIAMSVDGHLASTFKAVVYAPGCQIETISVESLSGSSGVAEFSCRELPTDDFIGRILQSESLGRRQYYVEINLMADWGHKFFGIADGTVTTFQIARVTPSRDGIFHVQLPDFGRDIVNRSFGMDTAGLQFIAREEGTGNILGMLEPIDAPDNLHGMLPLRSGYAGEVRFGIRATH